MSDDQQGSTGQDEISAGCAIKSDSRPSLLVEVFRIGLLLSDDPAVLAKAFVTPESVPDWSDFSRAHAIFETDLKIDRHARYRRDAPDVVYVGLTETNHHPSAASAHPAAVHVTLVWRPEIAVVSGNSWRVHHIGAPVAPENAPRSAPDPDLRPSN